MCECVSVSVEVEEGCGGLSSGENTGVRKKNIDVEARENIGDAHTRTHINSVLRVEEWVEEGSVDSGWRGFRRVNSVGTDGLVSRLARPKPERDKDELEKNHLSRGDIQVWCLRCGGLRWHKLIPTHKRDMSRKSNLHVLKVWECPGCSRRTLFDGTQIKQNQIEGI
mgnify:CR=1 FL=1